MRHWSSCAVHNEPAYPNGPCDCGGFTDSVLPAPGPKVECTWCGEVLLSVAGEKDVLCLCGTVTPVP